MAAALTLALASGGCSFSYQLGSLFGKDKDDETVTSTGSISAARQARSTDGSAVKSTEQAASPAPVDGDLDYARAAASEVLTSGRKDTSMPWQNPKTGARGTVTPLASAYNQDGMLCRDFLASYVRDGSESWLQGEACRKQQGKWEVRSLKPWKRS
ncbi:MAG: hypothetical protein HY659_12565 [Rhizobiales bacterium]|nr:hypothetical protein [Hyphomicrobiales bacterium]